MTSCLLIATAKVILYTCIFQTPLTSLVMGTWRKLKKIEASVIMKCQPGDGLLYDRSVVTSSIVTEYGLDCNPDIPKATKLVLGAMSMVGFLIGSILIGIFSDFQGRMKALMLSIVLVSAAGTLGAFMSDPIRYIGLKMVVLMKISDS